MISVNLDSLASLIVNPVIAMMMVPEMLLVMTTLVNAPAKVMLLETNVTSVLLDSLVSHPAKVKFYDKVISTFNMTELFLECQCNDQGSRNDFCDPEGHCFCKEHVTGDSCDHCEIGWFGFPTCQGT